MAILETELEKIASLAYIGMDADSKTQLTHDLGAIIDFVEQLRAVNTQGIAPLRHPLDQHQRLRVDEVLEKNQVKHLADIAPLFADDLYLVPKVIDIGK